MLKAENIIYRDQILIVKGIITVVFIVLISRYFFIQIVKHEMYHAKAEVNRIQAISLPAPRGLILDRDKNILVDNYPTFILSAIPREFENKRTKFNLINELTGIPYEILEKNYKRYYRNRFVNVRLAKNLNFEQLSLLEENKISLAGTYYNKLPERSYPSKINGFHFLGYVREVDRSVLSNLSDQINYDLGDLTGWNGIEKYYEEYLNGRKGIDFFEVNVKGEIVGQLVDRSIQPISGTDVRLTINSELQRTMERSMIEKKGSVLVSNAKTGDILAFVNAPLLSPELFSAGISHEEWENIIKDSDKPLLDRNTSGQYPPGSIFKLITLFPLIEEKNILSNWETFCGGSYNFGDRIFNCWKEEGHGTVNMEKAVAQSCNIYFYQAVQSIPLETWVETCRNFGFGKITQIDLPTEKKGLIPDRNYYNTQYGKWGWSKGTMLNLALGQGEILVTPIQLLQFANLVATHGYTNKLHFYYGDREVLLLSINYSINTWKLVDKFLLAAVSQPGATGKLADPHIKGLKVYGKTGTAQNPHGDPHAWFFGFGKYGEEIISIVVLIENGGHGSEVSAPIAQLAFDTYFSNKNIGQFTYDNN